MGGGLSFRVLHTVKNNGAPVFHGRYGNEPACKASRDGMLCRRVYMRNGFHVCGDALDVQCPTAGQVVGVNMIH